MNAPAPRTIKGTNRPVRLLLGLATLWPLLYFIVFVYYALRAVFFSPMGTSDLPTTFFVLHLVTMVVTLGLLVTYILDTFRNDRVAKDMKALWAVVLFMGSIFAMPIYWYLYVWRDSPPAVAGQPPTAAPNSR